MFRRSHSDLNILSDLFRIVNTFFYFFSSFFDIDFFAEKKRRKRDLNPRAATNDLLPFQGSPFSHLGTSPKCLYKTDVFICNRTLSCGAERVGFEPTRPYGQTVFKTASL